MEPYQSLFVGHNPAVLNTTAAIPALDTMSNLMWKYSGFNPITILPLLVPLATFVAAIKYSSDSFLSRITEYFTSTAEIKMDDDMYTYLMHWVSHQAFARKTRNIIAGTRISSFYYYSDEDKNDDLIEDWEGQESESADDGFDWYWERLTNRDKVKPVLVTPAYGVHYFRYNGHFVWLTRICEANQMSFWLSNKEKLYLSCLGRDPQVLKDLLREAQKQFVNKDGENTIIYRASKFDASSNHEWHRCMARPSRALSTVVLDQSQKKAIVADLKEYLHPKTRKWYAHRGIPYRRGYLLEGPPGTGKTSLSIALAALFSLGIYIVDLNSRALNEESLMHLFSTLPHRCIVLLEDIDSAGVTQKRNQKEKSDKEADSKKDDEEEAEDSKEDEKDNKDEKSAPKSASDAEKAIKGSTAPSQSGKCKISLSALLNAIDGVASSEGRILIMTTNHAELLDPALLRPGRVDMRIRFDNANAMAAEALFRFTYTSDVEKETSDRKKKQELEKSSSSSSNKPKQVESEKPSPHTASVSATAAASTVDHERISSLAHTFASTIPPNEFSPAEVQGYLLKHKRDAQAAVDGVADWIVQMRQEKLQSTTTTGKA